MCKRLLETIKINIPILSQNGKNTFKTHNLIWKFLFLKKKHLVNIIESMNNKLGSSDDTNEFRKKM